MSNIGHNSAGVFTLTRGEFRKNVVEKMDSTTDVLVGHTIEYLMDDSGECNASISEIMQCSKLKCRHAVMRSLARICDRIGLEKNKKNGRQNKYFLPQEIQQPVCLKDTGLKHTSTFEAVGLEDTAVPKPVCLKDTGSRAHTRARSLSLKNINPPHSPPLPSDQNPNRDGVCAEALPEGFEPLGHGAIINCETIQHPAFTISIPAVDMQFQLTPGCHEENARKHCMSFALQWAAAIEAGEEPFKVIPNNITRAISGSVTNKIRKQEAHENKLRMEGRTTRKVVRG